MEEPSVAIAEENELQTGSSVVPLCYFITQCTNEDAAYATTIRDAATKPTVADAKSVFQTGCK